MTPRKISAEQLRWLRVKQSGLAQPFASPEAAAKALIGVQAQILPAAGLSLWNRTRGLTHAQFEDLLFGQRRLVKLWGQRGTLHLYDPEDWALLTGALGARPSWWERQPGIGAKKAFGEVFETARALLQQHPHIGRAELRAAGVKEDYLSSWGGIFMTLVRRGEACHAPSQAGEGRFAARSKWLPGLAFTPPEPRQADLALARRFFSSYGPASVQDFAYWRGLSLSEARPLCKELEPALCAVEVEGQTLWCTPSLVEEPAPPPREGWPLRLLYRFDPLLLTHKEKRWLVPEAHYKKVWRPAGHVEGVLFARGEVWGTWRYERDARGLEILLSPFRPLPKELRTAFVAQAAEVATFFGLPLSSARNA